MSELNDQSGSPGLALYSMESVRKDGSPSDHRYTYVRGVTGDEQAAALSAQALLINMLTGSEHTNLEGYRDDLMAAVASQLQAVIDGRRDDIQPLNAITGRRFADYVAAFRNFDNRNRSWLSQKFGKGSEPFNVFVSATNTEFDRNAAYRLASSLRNVSTHGTQVLNLCSVEGKSLPNGGSVTELILGVDGISLVRDFRGRMRAATADEIEGVEGPLHLLPIAEEVFRSCTRIQAVTCLAIESKFVEAVALLEDLWEEASHFHEDEEPDEVWIMNDLAEQRPTDSFSISAMRVRLFLFDELHALPERWRRAVALDYPEITMNSLTVSPKIEVVRDPDGSLVL